MKGLRAALGLCLGVLAWGHLGAATPPAHAPLSLRICANSALGEPVDNPGAAYELLRRMQAAWPGLHLELRALPWSRCLQEAAAGQFEAVLGASWTPERAQGLAYPLRANGELDESLRVFRLGYVLVRRKGSAIRWSGHAFEGTQGSVTKAIGAERALSIVQFARAHGASVEDRFPNATSLIEALRLRRVAAVLLTQEFAATLMRDPAFAAAHEISGPVLQTRAYFIPFNQRWFDAHEPQVRAFWQAQARERATPGFRVHYALQASGGTRRDLLP